MTVVSSAVWAYIVKRPEKNTDLPTHPHTLGLIHLRMWETDSSASTRSCAHMILKTCAKVECLEWGGIAAAIALI